MKQENNRRIHLFEKNNRMVPVNPTESEWESGYWYRIGARNADALIGGLIYFHESQSSPSFGGGRILGWRIQETGEWAGRYVFRYALSGNFEAFAGVTAGGGWSGGGTRKIIL